MRLEQHEAGKRLSASDFPWLAANAPAYSERAVAALRGHLELHGDLIPLASDTGRFYALNVLVREDVLDFQRVEGPRFRDGRLMGIEQYAFRSDAPVERWSVLVDANWDEVFVTEDYVRAVSDTGLPGADFELVGDPPHGTPVRVPRW